MRWTLVVLLLLAGCADRERGRDVAEDSHDIRCLHDVKRVLFHFERDLEQELTPELHASWRVYLDKGNGVHAAWLTEHELLIENGRRELWSIARKPGEIGFSFSLDPNNDAPERRVARVASGKHLHIICNDSVLFTIDRFGNLEHQDKLFGRNVDLAVSEHHLWHLSPDRLIAWDLTKNLPAGIEKLVGKRVLADGKHVYVGNGQRCSCYSTEMKDPFGWQWSTRLGGAPQEMAVDARRLYVATDQGAVHAVRRKDGTRLWTVHTGPVSGPIVVGKQHVYAVGEGVVHAIADGKVDWRVPAERILAVGKRHVYLLHGRQILVVADGKVLRRFVAPEVVDLWWTNPYGPQLIVGANYKGKVGMFLSLTEPE